MPATITKKGASSSRDLEPGTGRLGLARPRPLGIIRPYEGLLVSIASSWGGSLGIWDCPRKASAQAFRSPARPTSPSWTTDTQASALSLVSNIDQPIPEGSGWFIHWAKVAKRASASMCLATVLKTLSSWSALCESCQAGRSRGKAKHKQASAEVASLGYVSRILVSMQSPLNVPLSRAL